MAGERLSKATVAETALRLGDEQGLEAVTIRRLAQELGVTPMALYWHFKNKDELFLGVVDHALADVRADRDTGDPWPKQLKAMVESLVGAMRRHPILPDLLHQSDKARATSFTRATEDALTLLTGAGFTPQQAYWVGTYLLHGVIGLVHGQLETPPPNDKWEVNEWRRQRRIEFECLPADQFPMTVRFGATYAEEPDPEGYYAFGIELLMTAVESMAARTGASS
ncbi:TetR/AcrR family transcriptional regulator [Paractinoplanes ovalisporus]|uniref:TetR/AcrR family transcriptional regulator n=1 Tax=Paractinoplanes ovalisporus TaxID=2810368 RepID=UPI0027DC1546|nr:TetR family transcriptional regulator [Actinoplanes ovalisporus]